MSGIAAMVMMLPFAATGSCGDDDDGQPDGGQSFGDEDAGSGDPLSQFSDGEWVVSLNREWDHVSGDILFPTDEFEEEDYQPMSQATSKSVIVSGDLGCVSVGDEPLVGAREEQIVGRWYYALDEGTFAGGRFVVWQAASGLQAELTIYGSGVPITSSQRGALIPSP